MTKEKKELIDQVLDLKLSLQTLCDSEKFAVSGYNSALIDVVRMIRKNK